MGDDSEAKTHLLAKMSITNEADGEARMFDARPPSLPLGLRILFAFNGITLALPVTALMYILNTRVAMPLSIIPSYAAIAFLPFSLKPCYAYLSASCPRRCLLTVLLIASGVCTAATAAIPNGSVFFCILLAFLRGLTGAWPEFLLGLELIEHAHRGASSYEEQASWFQSQAATSRYIGSLAAHLFAMGFLVLLPILTGKPAELNDAVVTALLLTTAVLNLVASAIAWWGCGSTRNEYEPLQSPVSDLGTEELSTSPTSRSYTSVMGIEETDRESSDSQSSITTIQQGAASSGRGNVYLIALLQLSIILFTLQTPLSEVLSKLGWRLLTGLSVLGLLTVAYTFPFKWSNSHCVGLYLILRYAMPTSGFMVDSFLYGVFRSRPLALQLFPVIDMAVNTLATWSYGPILSHFVQGGWLRHVIAATTGLAAVASLSNIYLVRALPSLDDGILQITLTIAIKIVLSWTNEWKFLPDVVLATVVVGESTTSSTVPVEEAVETRTEPRAADLSTSLKYGSLISCIDFGDQVGALLMAPIVSALGTTRENDWNRLDDLVLISSLSMFASIGLVFLLRR